MNFYKKLRINGNDYKIAVNNGGDGAPTTSTRGVPWQGYVDSSSNKYYVCLGQNESGEYIWVLANNVDENKYAKKSTTLSGYGITDAYTKDEIHQIIGDIASIVHDTLNYEIDEDDDYMDEE